MEQIFSKESFAEAASGMAADLVSAVALYPLDVIKSKVQTDSKMTAKKVYEELGVLGLFRGVSDKVIVSPQQKFQYFYCSTLLETSFRARMHRKPTIAESLVIGYLAAVEGLITTIPLDVTSVRRISSKNPDDRKKSFFASFAEIVEKEGMGSFYQGLTASILLCANPSITFVLYERLKRMYAKNRSLKSFESFALGAIAKSVATLITFPLIRLKIILNTWGKFHNGALPPPMSVVARDIVRDQGFLGLYTGIEAQLSKGILNSALMLMIKNRVDEMVYEAMGLKPR